MKYERERVVGYQHLAGTDWPIVDVVYRVAGFRSAAWVYATLCNGDVLFSKTFTRRKDAIARFDGRPPPALPPKEAQRKEERLRRLLLKTVDLNDTRWIEIARERSVKELFQYTNEAYGAPREVKKLAEALGYCT